MRVIVLIIISSVLFLILLGLRGLCEPDEGRYAEIAREMVESGDWLTPRLNYIKHFHKPPLVYWLVSSSLLFLGMGEFAARLSVALLGIFGLVITYLLSIRMGRDKKASFLSALVLATTMQYFIWTQVLSSDMVFSFFMLVAFYGFWTKGYVFYLGIALGFMTKGPVAVIISGLVIGIYTLITREKIFRMKQFLIGLVLFLAIVSPWFIYVCLKNPGLFKYFMFYQSLDRMFTSLHGRTGNIFYFIPVVIIGGLPWLLFLPWALRALKDRVGLPRPVQGQGLFLLLWIFVPIIFFSFSGSKLPGYILPIYPALAIIIGSYLGEKKFYRLFSAICVLSCIVYLAGTGVMPRFEEKLGDNLSIRKPADIINKYGSRKDRVINFRCFLQGLPFYLERRIILVEKTRETQFEEDKDALKEYLFPSAEEFFSRLKSDERIWCFSKRKDYPDLLKISPVPLYEVWEGSEYILISNYEI